ncbi:right-handed parallel beta-helix repeat-containing protein [Nocardioides sp.]|uniref:right-handed parallel beta-helix repeat-containing protein n=1 Tax=Nocardioides sp. TaxID=35761 RepID=UPI0035189970
MTTFRTVSGDLETITGGGYRNLVLMVAHNVLVEPGLVDLEAVGGPKTYLPGYQRITPTSGDAFTVSLIDTAGAGTNVPGGSLRWSLLITWIDGSNADRSLEIKNFELTADSDLFALASTADPPAVPANDFLTDAETLLNTKVAQAAGYRDEAQGHAATAAGYRDQAQVYALDALGRRDEAQARALEALGYRDESQALVDQQTELAAIDTTDIAVAYLSTYPSTTRDAQDARYVRRGQYALDPRDYGAKFDNATDDSAAFTAAFNAGATFGLPVQITGTGTALINSTLTPPSGAVIFNDGSPATIRMGSTLATLFDLVNRDGFLASGLNVTATNANTSVMVLARVATKRITLLRNRLTNARLIITNSGPTYSSITTAGPGGTPGTVTDLLLDSNTGIHTAGIENRGGRAFIELRYIERARIQGNDNDGYFHGIMWWGGDSAVDGGTPLGSNPRRAKDITIVNNATRNNFGGIWGSMGQDVTVAGNNVRDVTDVGIDFEGCFDCTATGNTVRNATYACYAVFFGCKRVTFSGNTGIIEAGVGTGSPSFHEGGVIQTGIGTGFKSHSKSNPSQYVKVIGNTFICPAECAYGDIQSMYDSTIENNTMVVTGANQRSVLFYDCDRLSVSYNRIHHQQAASLSIDLWGGWDPEIVGNFIRCASDSTASVTAATGAIRVVYRSSTFRAHRARITHNKTLNFATGITDVNSNTTAGQRESYAVITDNIVPTVAHYQTTNYRGRIANNYTPNDPTVATPETILT